MARAELTAYRLLSIDIDLLEALAVRLEMTKMLFATEQLQMAHTIRQIIARAKDNPYTEDS